MIHWKDALKISYVYLHNLPVDLDQVRASRNKP